MTLLTELALCHPTPSGTCRPAKRRRSPPPRPSAPWLSRLRPPCTLSLSPLLLLLLRAGGRCCLSAPRPPTIPSTSQSRLPSNIPLRTLPTANHQDSSQSASLLASPGDDARAPRLSSSSESSWTDTGDIGDQFADEDDPVRLQLPDELEGELLAGVQKRSSRHSKKVRIRDPSPHHHLRPPSRSRTIDKEAIDVPVVSRPRPSHAERCIGAIMSGRSGSIHGLTGKALLYESSFRSSGARRIGHRFADHTFSADTLPASLFPSAFFSSAMIKASCRASSRTLLPSLDTV